MNYFELYHLPEAFHIDQAAVKKKFYSLSKEFHPDFYINDTQGKQEEILELSTLNNRAFQVLSNPRKRLEYILTSHNLMTEGEKYQLPQSFLMEMMEVNEALMELEFDTDPEVLKSTSAQVEEIENTLAEELESYKIEFDQEQEPEKKESILLKIKDLYYRQKYLLRIRESLDRFASR